MNNKYFDEQLLEKLSQTPIISKKISANIKKGFHKSRIRGKNMEFREHRKYSYGDEIKDIDWKVYGRTEKYYVKDFDEDVSANILILIDTSSSMGYRNKGAVSKLDYAKYLGVALSYMFLKQRDVISLCTFDTDFNIILSPTSNKRNIDKILRSFEKDIKSNDRIMTDFNSLKKSMNIFKNSANICFIISDLISDYDNIKNAVLKMNRSNSDIVVFHLVDDYEETFDFKSYIEFQEPETGKTITVKASDIKDKYREMFNIRINKMKSDFRKLKIDYNKFNTKIHYSDNLIEFFKKHKIK